MGASIIDRAGKRQEVTTLTPAVYQMAKESNLSVPQWVNRNFETDSEKYGTAFEQLCASCGLILARDREFGLKPPTLEQVFKGLNSGSVDLQGGVVVKEADPVSRIIFPAVVIEMVESALSRDRDTDPAAFANMLALDLSITQDRYEQPVINYTNPEAARAKAIAQLAQPTAMLSITASDVSRMLPTFALSLEISDQALRSTVLDLVTMAVTRQSAVEKYERTYEYLITLLSGDADHSQSALSQTKADTYDSAIVAAGAVTKKALIKWMFHNQGIRRLSHVVTDSDGLFAIETALQTTNTGIFAISGLEVPISLVNRMIKTLQVFVVEDGKGWPANTLMGLDRRYAITRVRNVAAEYAAVEEFVLRKSKALRFDFSEVVYRQFDDAFDTLSLTLADS